MEFKMSISAGEEITEEMVKEVQKNYETQIFQTNLSFHDLATIIGYVFGLRIHEDNDVHTMFEKNGKVYETVFLNQKKENSLEKLLDFFEIYQAVILGNTDCENDILELHVITSDMLPSQQKKAYETPEVVFFLKTGKIVPVGAAKKDKKDWILPIKGYES